MARQRLIADDAEPPIVFLGPTLQGSDAASLLDAVYRPPAQRGDIYRALRDRFRVIVLIDGEFHGRPSIWQREIQDAIGEGAAVHGASSMGALRAAELHGFGMVGHGKIFEWYRDGVIEADDEVALTYGPQELGYPALSEPLVNIRATLAGAVPDVISADERDELIAHARGIYFPERSFAHLLRDGPGLRWSAGRRAAFADFLLRSRIDLKRRDAIGALRSVASGRQEVSAGNAPDSKIWSRERTVAEGFSSNVEAVNAAAIGQRAGIAALELEEIRRELSEVAFCAISARARGIAPTAGDIAAARHGLRPTDDLSPPRIEHLLHDRATAIAAVRTSADCGAAFDPRPVRRALILEWARAGGIENGTLQGDALVDWIIEAGPNHFGYGWWPGVELLHALRLCGRVAPPRSEPS